MHRTRLGGMIQDLFLSVKWDINRAYSKRDILLQMHILPPDNVPSSRLKVPQKYFNKCYQLLNSAFVQLNKKQLASVYTTVIAEDTNVELTPEEVQKFHKIRKRILRSFGATFIGDIYASRFETKFWAELDNTTFKELGMRKIRDRIIIRNYDLCPDVTVSSSELTQLIADTLVKNYAVKHKGAIGSISPEQFKVEMNELVSRIK